MGPEERGPPKKHRKQAPRGAKKISKKISKKITIPISKSVFLSLNLFYHYNSTYLKGYNYLECFS